MYLWFQQTLGTSRDGAAISIDKNNIELQAARLRPEHFNHPSQSSAASSSAKRTSAFKTSNGPPSSSGRLHETRLNPQSSRRMILMGESSLRPHDCPLPNQRRRQHQPALLHRQVRFVNALASVHLPASAHVTEATSRSRADSHFTLCERRRC